MFFHLSCYQSDDEDEDEYKAKDDEDDDIIEEEPPKQTNRAAVLRYRAMLVDLGQNLGNACLCTVPGQEPGHTRKPDI